MDDTHTQRFGLRHGIVPAPAVDQHDLFGQFQKWREAAGNPVAFVARDHEGGETGHPAAAVRLRLALPLRSRTCLHL